MQFLRSAFIALLSAPFLIVAQSGSGANPFNIPSAGLSVTAGQSTTLSWKPTTSGTVSLILRSGASSNLAAGDTIASGITNSGSYTWNVPSSAIRGTDYTIEIVDDSDPSQTNYTPYFVLNSSNVGNGTPGLSGTVSSGAPTSSLSLSTASPTVSSGATTTGVTTSTGTNSSGSATTTGTMTTTGTNTGSMMSSGSSSSGGSSSSNTVQSSVGIQTTSSAGDAARVTAVAGMLGAVALGALAL